jgi:anti-anti-sigma regulatory factor
VLKITRLCGEGESLTIKLEGEVLGPWVESLRDACAQWARRSRRLGLDLAAVTFVDGAGAQLLRDLVRQGNEITMCSHFVAELLQLGES